MIWYGTQEIEVSQLDVVLQYLSARIWAVPKIQFSARRNKDTSNVYFTPPSLQTSPFAPLLGRYPLHEERKRIEKEHAEELEKLYGQDPINNDADYHHGVHAGLLAASRMFQKQADILHVNDISTENVSDEVLSVAAVHKKVIDESRESYPDMAVATTPPTSVSSSK